MSKYILIKAPDNWIEREQLIARLKFMDPSIDIKSDHIFTCGDSQYITTEQLQFCPDAKDHIKKMIASHMGQFLLENDYIDFIETEDKDCIRIDGILSVIKD